MSAIQQVKFAQGAVIFKEGDKADAVYFIEEGIVEVARNDTSGKIILTKLGKDAVFGEMALIDKKPRSATVTSLEPVTALKATEAAFNSVLLRADPAIKEIMGRLVAAIREKNQTQKNQMGQADIALLTTIKQRNDKLRNDIIASQLIQGKVGGLDPFMAGLFQSLLKAL